MAHQRLTLRDAHIIIETEDEDGRPTFWRQAFDLPVFQAKVSFPHVSARMVKADQFTRILIERCQVRPLIAVTDDAAQREVVLSIGAAMLSRDGVVDLVRMQRLALG
jgi:hypothetical protein